MNIKLSDTLLATQNADRVVRQRAEDYLKNLEKKNFKNYINLLCDELSGKNNPIQSIMLAGILLKNAIDAKNIELKKSLKNRWLSLEKATREEIQKKTLKILFSNVKEARETAALVVSKIAVAESSGTGWNFVADSVLNVSVNGPSNETRSSALRAVGYLCEETPGLMADKINMVYELICRVCSDDNEVEEMKFEAVRALGHALVFGNEIFDNESQRNTILSSLFSTFKINSARVSAAAFDCLARFVELYYQFLPGIIPTALQLTSQILRANNKEDPMFLAVAHHSIEFWASLADIEAAMEESLEDRLEPSKERSLELIRRSLPGLAPLLLNQLFERDDCSYEEDTNDAADAAANCLRLCALSAKNHIIPHILPFLEQNIRNEKWKHKEAAICVFGLILEGPSKVELEKVVCGLFELILEYCNSDISALRDTASWTLAKICKAFPERVGQLIQLHRKLIACLRDKPRIAANACWAIYCLAESQEKIGTFLESVFDGYVESLLTCSKREDRNEQKLLSCCYETINALVLHSNSNSMQTVSKLFNNFIEVLKNSCSVISSNQINTKHQVEINNLQALLIGSLSSAIKILPNDQIENKITEIMNIFVNVLKSNDKTIFEEVLVAIGVIVNKIGKKFSIYVHTIKPFLMAGLSNNLGSTVCKVSAGVLGDVYRAIGDKILIMNVSDDFLQRLIQVLENPNIERKVKPFIITCFGDIAISINNGFERYLEHILSSLVTISSIPLDSTNFDDIDFQNHLRESTFECYSMMLLSLRETDAKRKFFNYAENMIQLVKFLVEDSEKDVNSVSSALAFIGDIIDVLGRDIKSAVDIEPVKKLIEIGKKSKNEKVNQSFQWAMKMVDNLSV